MEEEKKKKRGRPRLSPDKKAEREKEKQAKSAAYHAASGYAAQKKYSKAHPEKAKQAASRYAKKHNGELYSPHISIYKDFKQIIDDLAKTTGLSINQLFIGAVEEKYNVTLHKNFDD